MWFIGFHHNVGKTFAVLQVYKISREKFHSLLEICENRETFLLSNFYHLLYFHRMYCRKFTIVHDSQILQSIPNEDMFAYIHYMTLNDILARGYVRQFCMSYISARKGVSLFVCRYESGLDDINNSMSQLWILSIITNISFELTVLKAVKFLT